MDHHRTPLFTALTNHAARNPVQFHIPGHKKGAGTDREFREFIGSQALSIDLINIAPLDDLHQPTSVIVEAQQIATANVGSRYSFCIVSFRSSINTGLEHPMRVFVRSESALLPLLLPYHPIETA